MRKITERLSKDCGEVYERFKKVAQGTRELVRMLQESYFATFMKTVGNP